MSEPAKAEKAAPPKAATAKPKSTAPLPKQPGQSPATPTLAKLRRALGELIVGYKTGKTHMFGIYAANLRTALDAAGKVRNVATEVERKDLDGLELRARMLLIHVPGPDAKPTSDDGRLVIDWDYISDSIDQVVPGVGQVATKAPQQYRDCFEAVWRSTLYMKEAFREQWAEIQKHWFEFLYATATVVALETAALIASATPGTQLLGIVIQGLIIAFVAYAAVEIGAEAGQLTEGFWHSVKEANGDASKIDAAAAKFARLVIYILRLLAEAVAGGVIARLSMKGMRHIVGEKPVPPRPATGQKPPAASKEGEPTSGSSSKPQEPKTREAVKSEQEGSSAKTPNSKPQEPASKSRDSSIGSKSEQTKQPSKRPVKPPRVEIRVAREQLKIKSTKHDGVWDLKVQATLPDGSVVELVDGWTTFDGHGLPEGGPKFTVKKTVGSRFKVQVYEGGNVVSLTDLALDETLAAFKRDFGHPPDSLPGTLGWDNAGNFQRSYVDALDAGLGHDAACQTAIREISFGRSRVERGYGDFTITADRFADINLDIDKGPMAKPKKYGTRHVPTHISINTKRSR